MCLIIAGAAGERWEQVDHGAVVQRGGVAGLLAVDEQ